MSKYKEKLQEVEATQCPEKLEVGKTWEGKLVFADTKGPHVDVNGVPCRPGDWLVTYGDGVKEVLTDEEFALTFEAVKGGK